MDVQGFQKTRHHIVGSDSGGQLHRQSLIEILAYVLKNSGFHLHIQGHGIGVRQYSPLDGRECLKTNLQVIKCKINYI